MEKEDTMDKSNMDKTEQWVLFICKIEKKKQISVISVI